MAKNLFSGLDKMGLGMLSGMELYESDEKSEDIVAKEQAEKVLAEADFVFDKTYKCPVCESEFKSKAVKTGKAKLTAIDEDLRPKYQGVDSLKYDSIVCNKCGYAALSRYFNFINASQSKLISEKITPNYKGGITKEDIYSYDESINRHQLALANAVVKKGKVSERGYICLKLAWLMRGKAENIPDSQKDKERLVKEIKEMEKQYLTKAYEGLYIAMMKEPFPIAGMDEWTFSYLVAALAKECEDYAKSQKLLADIIVARAASPKLKEKARELRKSMQNKL